MKIGIIGVGVVGKAILEGFKSITNDHVILGYDKYKNIGSFNDMLNSDIVFICVPTTYSEKNKEYNKTELHNVLSELQKNNYNGLVLIKSTLEPTTTEQLSNNYNLKLIHNPEFLSAISHIDDFINQNHIVIGKTSNITQDDLNVVVNMYKSTFPNVKQSICTSNESECMKIFVNNFYSVKIQFCNELYQICQKINVNYSNVRDLMLKNNWINPMHTNVPGPDGQLSYGGMCFPKDTNALLSFMKTHRSEHKVLESCIDERNEMRTDHVNVELKSDKK